MAVKIDSTATKGDRETHMFLHIFNSASPPLFKQGERTDVNNYRPISFISIIAKVFERIVSDQLYSFLANEEIITNQQSGFRSLHSTVTALLEATDSWALDIDRGNVNAVVFLDLKKAFDTVDHDVLLGKLSL